MYHYKALQSVRINMDASLMLYVGHQSKLLHMYCRIAALNIIYKKVNINNQNAQFLIHVG